MPGVIPKVSVGVVPMTAVRKHVEQAQRRLNTNILLDRLTGAMITGSLLGGLTLVADRLLNLDRLSWVVFAGLAVLLIAGWHLARMRLSNQQLILRGSGILLLSGITAALVWAIVQAVQFNFQGWHLLLAAGIVMLILAILETRMHAVDTLGAAVKLDEAAGVRERISSAIALPASSDPFVQATHRDAERVAATVHVPSRLPLIVPERTPWSAAGILAVLGIFLFLPQFDLLAQEEQRTQEADRLAQREEQAEVIEAVNRELKQVSDLAKSHPALAEVADELDPLDVPDGPDATPDDVRRDALLKLDNVADKLESKLMNSDASMIEQLKKNLSKLQPPNSGDDAASELSESLAKGDLDAAGAVMEKLKQQLEAQAKSGDAESQAKVKELAAKLDELAKQLEKVSDNEALEKALENQAGMSPEQAKKLIENLAEQGITDPKALEKLLQQQLGEKLTPEQLQKLAQKMAQNNQACQACKGLGESLAKAAQAMAQGQQGGQQGGQQAGQALAEALDQLGDLEMAEQMMNDLQAQLAQLDNLMEGVGGAGQDQQQNKPQGTGPKPGLGYGDGIGREKVAHQTKRERGVGPLGKGQIIGEVLVNAPLQRTESGAAVRNAVQSAVREAEEAVEREEVPRQYHQSMKSYFEKLAGLVPQQGGGASESGSEEAAE
jgi:predicted transcriptional regulator YheO